MNQSIVHREPAVLISVVVGVLIAVGGFFAAWGEGVDWRVALGGAITAGATAIGGGFLTRSQVYSPATAEGIMDAEAVIAEAERGGHA